MENIPDIRPPEFVDGLVVVSNHTKVFILGGQQVNQFKLGCVGVLILVHHNILKPLLIIIQHLRLAAEQFHGLHNQIVKVQGIVLFQTVLVFLVNLPNLFLIIIPSALSQKILRGDKLILRTGNLAHHRALLEHSGVNIHGFINLF